MNSDIKATSQSDSHLRPLAWVDGWVKENQRWQLNGLRFAQGQWVRATVSPKRVLKGRLFEPSASGLRVLGTENRGVRIPDLSRLSPLVEPMEVLGPMRPGAYAKNHRIYVAETPAGRLFLPALLLIDHLWLWSIGALRRLLSPNSLDVFMGRAIEGRRGTEVMVSPGMISSPPSDAALQRLAWLAGSADARNSWSSVLAHALGNQLDIALPKARMSGWVWGARLRSGLMVCELASVEFSLDTPYKQIDVRIRSRRFPFPAAEGTDGSGGLNGCRTVESDR